MLSLRFAVVSIVLASAIACGDYEASPTSPSPTPSPAPTPAGPASSVVIPVGAEALGNRAYSPPDLEVVLGTTVTWRNADSVTHTSTSDAPGWNSGSVAPGREFSFRFETAGTFPYHCTIHPGMVGRIVAR